MEYLSSISVPVLLLVFVFQSPQDFIRQHSEAAEALRRAGNLAAAEKEYRAVLAEGYAQLLECDASLQDDGGDSARAESLRARAQAIRAGATSYIAPGFPTTRRNIES